MVRNAVITTGLVSVAFGIGMLVGGERAEAQAAKRVLEIRRYTANEGKLPELVKRMGDHEKTLFEKHGMKTILFSTAMPNPVGPVPADAPSTDNIFIYVLAHDSVEAAKKSWAGFRGDPEWKKVQQASEANGRLLAKSEVTFLDPTDFSPTK
jgi:hypothetical protein